MTLDLAAIPLALLAGIFGILSPCVWPLVPVVTSSAAVSGRRGPVYLALGLSVSFAVAGTLLSWGLVAAGLDPELFRPFAAVMLLVFAVVLLVPSAGDFVARQLSGLVGRLPAKSADRAVSARGQFGVGALLGIVWFPCVGPTLGAAIALASLGRSLPLAFVVMLAYGAGTAGVLVAAGVLSSRVLARWRPGLVAGGRTGKRVLGWSLMTLGLLVMTGLDKRLEALATGLLPAWALTF